MARFDEKAVLGRRVGGSQITAVVGGSAARFVGEAMFGSSVSEGA